MTTPNKSVYFVSLGCPKNLVDSQVMLGKLKDARYELAQDPKDAQVIIVNTCSFIDSAKKESVDTVLEMADYKTDGKCETLVISGCLVQRYSKDLETSLPEVDLMIGTGQYHKVTEFLDQREEDLRVGGELPVRAYVDQPAFIHTEDDSRLHTGASHSAFLKISEGCNRRCSFCIIPKLRGFVRSRTIESLVKEAERLAATGVKELNLVAQDLTHYGIETRYKENLEKLLPELCKIDGIEWIRLHYIYPDQFSPELVRIVAREPKIVKYLDMPIQHTNDRMLGLMNRKLTKTRLFDLIAELREQVPEMIFRTSIIVGFPGETEEEYQELKSDLLKLELDYVGVFSYSKEEGTAAATLDGHLPASIKNRRLKDLRSALSDLSQKKMKSRVGLTTWAMVEGPSPESEYLIQARLSTQAMEIDGRILINDLGSMTHPPKAGDFVKIEITEALPFEFIAKVV